MHEADGDAGFATGCRLGRSRTGLGILVHIFADISQQLEGIIFTKELHQSCQFRIGGAGAVRVGHLNFAFVSGVFQIVPACRWFDAFFLQDVCIVSDAQCTSMNADGLATGNVSHVHGPAQQILWLQARWLGQIFGCGDEVRIAGTSPPDINLWIARFGANLSKGFSC